MLETKYDAKKVEIDKYDKWLKEGYFKAGDLSKKPYCIVIPPPNVTGKLHIGHTFDNALQDMIILYKRMRGFDCLYLPGMDHAGIATQAKVDARLKKEGISRYDLGREGFLKKAWQWKDEYAAFIKKQWALTGISVDYSKERFTLDEGLSKAVVKVFVDYYKEGLIYQGKRVINWDPVAKTALSNIEVIHKDVKGKMYYFKYHLVDSDDTFEVATTRPETMFGDVCVVVNPKDEKLKHLIGKKCINPANGSILPIIGDEYIEIGFGTGAMKCTPAHDPNDYQIALRHNLEMPICMNEDATMNELCGEFKGMDRYKCRDLIVEKIKAQGQLVKIENIVHSVGFSERTDTMVEPYLSKQWFVKMKPLAKEVLKYQKNDETKINFYPKRFEKTFISWLDEIEDWCISRQLWWGHRIPVYYNKKTKDIYCEYDPPKDIENYVQDEDVLDTWFSSALWPFSTLGWPEKTDLLKRYFPTDCLVTGYDIIFFWVARMAVSSYHFMHKRPFKDCLIHGLVRDDKGRKMSKSLGNGIDPIDIINKYGYDSLRLFFICNATPGYDLNFSIEKIEASWNFINKLWNATRFVLMNIDDDYHYNNPVLDNDTDNWIIYKLNNIIKKTTLNIERYEMAIAANELESFIWNDFCASYIEFTKSALNGFDKQLKHKTLNTLVYVLDSIVRLLHPFIPFVTEELYQAIHGKDVSICQALWPDALAYDAAKAKHTDILLEIIKASRELRNENNVKPSKELEIQIDGVKISDFDRSILSKMTKLIVVESLNGETLVRPISVGKIYFKMDEIVNKQEELEKINKELSHLDKEIIRSTSILSNDKFLAKAPVSKINEEKEKLNKYRESYLILQEKKKELSIKKG